MANRTRFLREVLESGVSPELHLAFTLARVCREWESLLGRALGSRTAPRRLEGRVLFVAAESPAAAQALQFERARLLRELKERFQLPLEELRVQVGSIRSTPAPGAPRRRASPPPVPLSEEEVSRQEQAFREKVADPEIAQALARLAVACRRRFGPRNGERS